MSVDVPSIVSGDRIVYLDPQENIWPGDPGQCYDLQTVRGTDMVVPFSGIEEFDHNKTTKYPKTIFRFPLRDKASGLSDNTYTTESLTDLIDEIKEEAKVLLLFLRSVHTVEVYDIPQLENKCYLYFRVQVAPESQTELIQQRAAFLTDLRTKHKLNPFKISKCITDVARLDVVITDTASQQPQQCVSWLIASQVGSSKKQILEAASKQHVFPWVGVAIELSTPPTCDSFESLSGGRVFCFLPLPVETSSKLSVHVNGTFGLNDDRRSIKWPVKERRNDPVAHWNEMLVTDCLPSCYNVLLKTAIEHHHISPQLFYHAWPVVDVLRHSHWSLLLDPLFSALFQWECLWAQRCGKWVSIKHPTVVLECDQLPEVVKRVLTKLRIPLCEVPKHVFDTIKSLVLQVSPSHVGDVLRGHLCSYQTESYGNKLELLRYLLEDGNFLNLNGLELLPMADHTFKTFSKSVSYICSEVFSRKLLPNLDHKLVDLRNVDKDLHDRLEEGAGRCPALKLKCLSASVVANLLPQCYPQDWKNRKIVSISPGNKAFPFEWCELFWMWVQNHDLSLFIDKLVVPLVNTKSSCTVDLTTLSTQSRVVLIESDTFPSVLIRAFAKLGVLCTSLKHVPYLQHRQRLKFFNSCNPTGVLAAISNSGWAIQNVQFSSADASQIQSFLASQKCDLEKFQTNILEKLSVFHVHNLSSPVSLLEASRKSWIKKAILSPHDFCFTNESLPSNLIMLSSTDNVEVLVQACASLILMPDSLMSTSTLSVEESKYLFKPVHP